jgi:predicted ArsR family transcriptional regulator
MSILGKQVVTLDATGRAAFPPGSGRDRVLVILKTKGPHTAAGISERLGVTTIAVRQHLAVLAREQLVDFTDDRRKVGRPARIWRLTPQGDERFGDGHADLAVAMLEATKGAFGREGLERLTAERTRQQVASYQARMPGDNASLEDRLASLARLRREEGFMAELRRNRDGTFELVENHCSIAKAARAYPILCAGEPMLFRAVLGRRVAVARTQHMLAGDRCCSYCISDRDVSATRARLRPSNSARPGGCEERRRNP